MTLELRRVRYMPKDLKPGILYFSEEFNIAIHLCACGCGTKVKTPIGPTEWSIKETHDGPTLRPSVGNWQEACQSHYLITNGEILWADKWTAEEVSAGRDREERRRSAYYQDVDHRRVGRLQRAWRWFLDLWD